MWILIAFVVVIALTALAIMAVFGEFGSASNAQNAQNVFSGVSSLVSNVVTDYAANPNFTGINAATVISAGAAPAGWAPDGATTMSLPGGGSVTVTPTSVPDTNATVPNGFEIELPAIDKADCAALGTFYTPNVFELSVNGTAVSNPDYGTPSTSDSSWPPALAVDCKNGSNAIDIYVAGQ